MPVTRKSGVYSHSDSTLVRPTMPAALISMPIAIRRSAGKRSARRPEQ